MAKKHEYNTFNNIYQTKAHISLKLRYFCRGGLPLTGLLTRTSNYSDFRRSSPNKSTISRWRQNSALSSFLTQQEQYIVQKVAIPLQILLKLSLNLGF